MIRRQIIILFLFSFLPFATFAQDNKIKMDAEEIPLISLIQYLETNHGFLFSYKEEDVQGIQVVPINKTSTIDVFLSNTLSTTDLEFEIIQENYIVFTLKKSSLGQNEPPSDILKTLCGRVVDKLTNESLPAANIYLARTQKGASASSDGFFSFESEIQKNDSVIVSYVGFQEKKISVFDLLKDPCTSIELGYNEYSEDWIVIIDYLTDGIDLSENGALTKIKPNRIGALPGQAEPDVLQTIQFLPGISSPDQSASSINIRGGTPDQNLILWEDIPIYHTAHYFGTVSAINPYIIEDTKVYRGGFNAEYGGRISGVIDMKSSDKTIGKNDFIVGANLLHAYANGKIKLKENKASLIFSVRRSISDLWQSPTFNDLTQRVNRNVLYQLPNFNRTYPDIRFENKFKFFDSNVKFNYQVSKKDDIAFAFFYGNNDFQSLINDDENEREQKDSLYLFNRGLSVSWNRDWNSKFKTKLSTVYSNFQYDYDYSLKTMEPDGRNRFGEKESGIIEKQIHFSGIYQFPFNHSLKIGYQVSDYDVAFKITRRLRNDIKTDQDKKYLSLLHVLYGTWNTDSTKKFGAKIGIRGSYYNEEQEAFFEPRLRLWYRMNDELSFYANTGKYYQFLSQLIEIQGDRSSIEIPVWVLTGNKEVPILNAQQHQLGFLFKKDNWIIDVQTYYKTIEGMTSLASGFGDDFSNQFHIGKASVKGIDLLVKKRIGNFRSWISYSLGKVDHQFDTFFDRNFSAPHDQRHIVNWVNMMTWKNWEFSVGWKYSSGTPYSKRENYEVVVEQNGMEEEEEIEPIVREFNSENLSAVHHIDASLLYSISGKNKKWKGVFGISLYNVYNQRNSYQRGLFIEDAPNNIPDLTYSDKFDVGFMPNFVAKIEF